MGKPAIMPIWTPFFLADDVRPSMIVRDISVKYVCASSNQPSKHSSTRPQQLMMTFPLMKQIRYR